MRSSESRDDVVLYTGSKQHSGPDLQTKPGQYHKLQAKALPKSQAAALQGLVWLSKLRSLLVTLNIRCRIIIGPNGDPKRGHNFDNHPLQRPTRCRQLQLPLAVAPQILQLATDVAASTVSGSTDPTAKGPPTKRPPPHLPNEGCWQKQLPVSNDGSFRPILLQLALPLRGPPASDVDFRISRFSTGASQDQPVESHGLKSFVAFLPSFLQTRHAPHAFRIWV